MTENDRIMSIVKALNHLLLMKELLLHSNRKEDYTKQILAKSDEIYSNLLIVQMELENEMYDNMKRN